MAKTIAPHDPAPIRDTDFFGKLYHWTWHMSRKTKKMQLTLHKGLGKECRRQHRYQDGDLG